MYFWGKGREIAGYGSAIMGFGRFPLRPLQDIYYLIICNQNEIFPLHYIHTVDI